MSLLRQGTAQILTIYLGESDQWRGTPLYVAMVQFLREQGVQVPLSHEQLQAMVLVLACTKAEGGACRPMLRSFSR